MDTQREKNGCQHLLIALLFFFLPLYLACTARFARIPTKQGTILYVYQVALQQPISWWQANHHTMLRVKDNLDRPPSFATWALSNTCMIHLCVTLKLCNHVNLSHGGMFFILMQYYLNTIKGHSFLAYQTCKAKTKELLTFRILYLHYFWGGEMNVVLSNLGTVIWLDSNLCIESITAPKGPFSRPATKTKYPHSIIFVVVRSSSTSACSFLDSLWIQEKKSHYLARVGEIIALLGHCHWRSFVCFRYVIIG